MTALETMTAKEVIRTLNLKPLPEEGGYYRETYRAHDVVLPAKSVGINSDTTRNVCTGIYYLVVPESFSALHRVKSDEMFHFYSGDPIEMIQIDDRGKLQTFTMSANIFAGESPQVVVPRGVWQGLRLKPGGKWALMGTTVAPGFEFEDFEVGVRQNLITQFPELREQITRFTREPGDKTHL